MAVAYALLAVAPSVLPVAVAETVPLLTILTACVDSMPIAQSLAVALIVPPKLFVRSIPEES